VLARSRPRPFIAWLVRRLSWTRTIVRAPMLTGTIVRVSTLSSSSAFHS
jgi:hypothetical protein